MQEEIIKTICDMIKIPSVSGNEVEIKNVLQYVRNFFGKKAVIREFNYNGASPVMLISNKDTNDFDVIAAGHLDVVPAKEEQFSPIIEGDKIYGRGSSDMKSQMVVTMYNMLHVIEKKTPLNFGILITTDEETTSNGIKGFVENENISTKIILDIDAGDLNTIVEKYKHSVGAKLKAKGISAHSSRPWVGENAISNLFNTINELKKDFPEYSVNKPTPKDTWIDTMVVTCIDTPKTGNVVPDWAEAGLNFRLTDKKSLDDLKNILQKACINNNCEYEITMASCGCYMNAKSPEIQKYKKIAEQVIGHSINIEHMNGATDSRMFADKSIIIMHSINGDGIHGINEWGSIDSIYKLMQIQRTFLESIK